MNAPKGTKDVLPAEVGKWHKIEDTIRAICARFGYQEIRTPVFESTELFERGVGDATDVVNKEMYTFLDKGGRSITLRPEGTSAVVRSYVEHHLEAAGLPQKLYYIMSCYRYEKPQAGRLREFHQFGIETFGAQGPDIDAEIIALAHTLFSELGVTGLQLRINSIGCPVCRKEYNEALRNYFESHRQTLCGTCQERLEKNPLRILDCKSPVCHEIAEKAPVILDYLCEDCHEHFSSLQEQLKGLGMDFTVDPHIVRGLDYYTKTVFEFVSDSIGAQGTVCGGGRYDGLVEELGGAPTCGMGFGLGLERLLLLLESQQISLSATNPLTLYLATIGEEASRAALPLLLSWRKQGISCEKDYAGRSLKAQMKQADRLGVRYVIVLGEEELKNQRVQIKEMATGETTQLSMEEIVSFCQERGE